MNWFDADQISPMLAFLKGKTSLHAGPGSLTAKASRPRPSENHRSQIGAKS
jgi:hypothetical protein